MFYRKNTVVQPVPSKDLKIRIWSRQSQYWFITFGDDTTTKAIIVDAEEAKVIAQTFNIQVRDTDVMYAEAGKELAEKIG